MSLKNILTQLKILLVVVGLSAGCSDKVYEQKSDKYPFEKKMKSILGENLEVIDSIRRAEVQISYFEISKNENQINQVLKLLDTDGWVLKGSGIGVDTYCLGKNNRVNVVIPIMGKGLYDFKGDQIRRTDYSVNAVLYSYDKWGSDMCE